MLRFTNKVTQNTIKRLNLKLQTGIPSHASIYFKINSKFNLKTILFGDNCILCKKKKVALNLLHIKI